MPLEPGMPDVIVEYGDKVHVRSDGQPIVDTHLILTEQNWGEMVSGYRCCECGQIQSEAFPVQCEFEVSHEGHSWRCPNMMRDDQMRKLGAEFQRRGDFNPPDVYDVIDVEQEDWKPKSGIWVPGSDAA